MFCTTHFPKRQKMARLLAILALSATMMVAAIIGLNERATRSPRALLQVRCVRCNILSLCVLSLLISDLSPCH